MRPDICHPVSKVIANLQLFFSFFIFLFHSTFMSLALRSTRAFRLNGLLAGAAAAGALAYYLDNKPSTGGWSKKPLAAGAALNQAAAPSKPKEEYQKLYNAIANKIREEDDADQGAGRYGVLVRLAWHSAGSYSKKDNSGGTFGGTMVYTTEATDGGNAGLEVARDFLSEFTYSFPWVSRGDLWTLGGVCAVQEAGGPKIPWRAGRVDCDPSKQPPQGRLPDATQGAGHVRDVFSRLGFDDRETVALIGAHCLGRCHTWRSGFDGPWGPSPNMFTNDFFVRLLQGWHVRKWDGVKQYEDDETNSFMMLPTDMALKEDSGFLKYVKQYAEDQDLFFADFSKAFAKLLEKGIEFPKNTPTWEFKTLDDQEED
ncbi:heme peroxidase [Clavispora lusitaniae]|nr:heme peroxidase [Clavispora lusitaniae]